MKTIKLALLGSILSIGAICAMDQVKTGDVTEKEPIINVAILPNVYVTQLLFDEHNEHEVIGVEYIAILRTHLGIFDKQIAF